jgi:hypothetical protein
MESKNNFISMNIDSEETELLEEIERKMQGSHEIIEETERERITFESTINGALNTPNSHYSHFGGCWEVDGSERKAIRFDEILKHKREAMRDGLIFSKIINIDQCGSTFVYISQNKILTIGVKGRNSGKYTVMIEMTLKNYRFIPNFVIDMFKCFNRHDCQSSFTYFGFEEFINGIESIIRKTENNSFYPLMGNTILKDQIAENRKKFNSFKSRIEQEIGELKKEIEKLKVNSEVDKILALQQEIDINLLDEEVEAILKNDPQSDSE